ncbi:hypothetical protein LCGC14_1986190 [marine sediment metagenome]|uniref:Uncharacterized protein n=1 Tax=marine sediment metagenome TaxID=412755 RepID=A0A0F9F7R2_9ZZZZ
MKLKFLFRDVSLNWGPTNLRPNAYVYATKDFEIPQLCFFKNINSQFQESPWKIYMVKKL